MIRCIAIDDEPLALKQINGYVNKISYLDLLKSFTSAIKALEYLQDENLKDEELDPEKNCIIGKCYTEIKQYSEAKEHFEKSIELNPKLGDTYASYSLMYLYQKKNTMALEILQKGLDATNNDSRLKGFQKGVVKIMESEKPGIHNLFGLF